MARTYIKWGRERTCTGGKFKKPRTKEIIRVTEKDGKIVREKLNKR